MPPSQRVQIGLHLRVELPNLRVVLMDKSDCSKATILYESLPASYIHITI